MFVLISRVILQREHCVFSAPREQGHEGEGWTEADKKKEAGERKRRKENHTAAKSDLVFLYCYCLTCQVQTLPNSLQNCVFSKVKSMNMVHALQNFYTVQVNKGCNILNQIKPSESL